VQTTLLGLAIAFILALLAALIGPYYVDWNQFRPQFELEASRVVGAPVRVGGELSARLLPAPSLRLRSLAVGGANDLGKIRADRLDVEFSLGSLMRGEWRATEMTINGMSLDLGLDSKGRVDWPVSAGSFNLGSLAIDRFNLTGRIALHDAASRSTVELSEIAFSGDVRSLAGSVRGDGNFTLSGTRYPFRISSGPSADGRATRVHLNIDPGQQLISTDLDGVLSFESRAPRFEGAVTLATPGLQKAAGGAASSTPLRIFAKVKADPAAARLEQIELSYGAEERALKLAGTGDVRFGAAPLVRVALSARQLDADRAFARDNAEPVGALAGLRALMAEIPPSPIPAQIEFTAEQVMLGGRPLQDISAELHSDAKSWTVHRLEFRAPGTTRVSLSGAVAQGGSADNFRAALNVESSDPDALMTWLQGRTEATYRSQKPLRLRGDVSVAPGGFAIDAMKAEIDGGAIEGRIAVSHPAQNAGARVEAELKAERLDLDQAVGVIRSLAGPQAEWPDEVRLKLDVGRAISAGQELRPLVARLGYDAKTISLDRLQIGQPDSVTLDGKGSFDRVGATGKLALNSTAASLGQFTAAIAPLAPALAARLNAMGPGPGPARVKLTLDLDNNTGQAGYAGARAAVDLDAPQLKGAATVTARLPVSALQSIDMATLGRNELGIDAKLSSAQGRSLLALLGLDRVVAAGEGPLRFEGSANGAWGSPLRLNVKLAGAGMDAAVQGTAEPWAADLKASFNLRIGRADLAPLLDIKPSNGSAQNIALSSRVTLSGNKLTFDDLDSTIAGSRLRGRLAFDLGDQQAIEGEIGMDQLALAPAFAFATGAAGRDVAEPLASGLAKGWRGSVAFQALRGVLPGGGELQPVSGIVRSDGQSLFFDAIKGKIGGGEASTTFEVRQGSNGVAVNASVQLDGVDGAALRYRGLAMPAGHISLQATLASQGRSASALTGALSGSGIVTLESAKLSGLDPRAFDAAIRSSDSGLAKDDARLKQIVGPALAAGTLSIASAQIPFNIRDGRIRVGATALDGSGARAMVSGGYDIAGDQIDLHVSLASTVAGVATSRPEIELLAVGSSDALSRTIDVTGLSSWLAVRAIDRETRRLDSIERGEPPPAQPAAIPLPAEALPSPETPDPGRAPSRLRLSPSRPPLTPPAANVPAPDAAGLANQPEVAPLPPAIDVKPAPGAMKPRPRPPLSLTPQVANPPARPAF